MPITKVTIIDENYFKLKDAWHIDRWMCAYCGFILDYQFDSEQPGWPIYDPSPNEPIDDYIDEEGNRQVRFVDSADVKTYCARCGTDIEQIPLIKIRVMPDEKIEDLLPLIAQGEGKNLEFKESFPDGDKIGKVIASFANTDGGKIIFGVNNQGGICGFPDIDSPEGKEQFQQRIRGIVGQIAPKIDYQVNFYDDAKQRIAVITVPSTTTRAGIILFRTG